MYNNSYTDISHNDINYKRQNYIVGICTVFTLALSELFYKFRFNNLKTQIILIILSFCEKEKCKPILFSSYYL